MSWTVCGSGHPTTQRYCRLVSAPSAEQHDGGIGASAAIARAGLGVPFGGGLASVGRMLDLVRDHMRMEVAFVSEFVGDQRIVREVSASGPTPLTIACSDPVEQTYCRRIADGQMDQLIVDARQHPVARTLALTELLGIGCYIGVPIVLADGTTFGTLCTFSSVPDPTLTDRDVRFVRLIADLVAERISEERHAHAHILGARDRVTAALDAGEPTMVYQPLVALRSGRRVGVEALARFGAAPHRPPEEWFADAHLAGLAIELEVTAVRYALVALDRLTDDVYLAVNVSAPALCSAELATVLDAVPPGRLVLELTEHDAITDLERLRDAIDRFGRSGIRFAIDDVGAGYSGLTHILQLGPDIVKLDRAIVSGVDASPPRRALVAAALSFAASVGTTVIAEGIEQEAELDTLLDLGVTFGQGFLLGRPEPVG